MSIHMMQHIEGTPIVGELCNQTLWRPLSRE